MNRSSRRLVVSSSNREVGYLKGSVTKHVLSFKPARSYRPMNISVTRPYGSSYWLDTAAIRLSHTYVHWPITAGWFKAKHVFCFRKAAIGPIRQRMAETTSPKYHHFLLHCCHHRTAEVILTVCLLLSVDPRSDIFILISETPIALFAYRRVFEY